MTQTSQPLGDGDISEEKLRQLLGLGGELDDLDFKSHLDLSTTKDRVELVKDLGAFQSYPSGGYIVIGVEDSGSLVPAPGTLDPKQFDPANLTQIAHSYLPTIRLAAATHIIEGTLVALIYVGPPNPPGLAIFVKDGQYVDGGKPKTAFRTGDVFVRRGTRSVRWHPGDLAWVLKPWEDQIREDERRRSVSYAQTVSDGNRARDLAAGPLGSLTWRVSSDDFDRALLEVLRAEDRMALRSLMLGMGADGHALLRAAEVDEMQLLLDRLTAALALCITYEQEETFHEFLAVLASLYAAAIDGNGDALPSPDGYFAARLWSIGVAVEGLGGLAVRLGANWAVRPLTLPGDRLRSAIREPSWIRHALTQAARANLLHTASRSDPDSTVAIGGPVVAVARQLVERIPALRPDTTVTPFELNDAPEAGDEVLNSLVQFDVFWCIIAVANGHDWNSYPSFAAFFDSRALPAFERLVTDLAFRELLLNGDADKLKPAMLAVVEEAQGIAMNDYRRPWSLHQSRVVKAFYE